MMSYAKLVHGAIAGRLIKVRAEMLVVGGMGSRTSSAARPALRHSIPSSQRIIIPCARVLCAQPPGSPSSLMERCPAGWARLRRRWVLYSARG